MDARPILCAALMALASVGLSCDVPTYTPDNGIFYVCKAPTDCLSGWVCVEAEDEASETPGSNSVSVCLELCPADGWCGEGWSCISAEVEAQGAAHDEQNEQVIGVCVPDGLAPAGAGAAGAGG